MSVLSPTLDADRPRIDPAAITATYRRDVAVVAAFLVTGAVKLATHEMWRDELQAWMISRGSDGLTSLFENLRYEGTPPLWHLLLFITSRVTSAPQAMQVLHLGIAAATVAVVVRRAPFPYWQRVLFCFGYFPFFEYLNISRSYALGLLLSVVFCAIAWRPDRNWLRIGSCLALLALTSVYGSVLSAIFLAAVVCDEIGHRAVRPRRMAAAAGLVGMGWIVALVCIVPPADHAVEPGWAPGPLASRLLPALGEVWQALVPLPSLVPRFWGTNVLADGARSHLAVGLLGLLLTVLVASRLRKDRVALGLWLTGTATLLAFSVLGFHGSLRHWGHLMVLLVVVAWLTESREESTTHSPDGTRARSGAPLRSVFVAVLSLQVAASVVATTGDLLLPFSTSEQAASFIRNSTAPGTLIVGEPDFAASSVSAWLGRDVVYLRANRTGSFVIWDDERACPDRCGSDQELLRRAVDRLATDQSPAVLVVNRRVEGVEPVAVFVGSIVGDEDYYLYELTR